MTDRIGSDYGSASVAGISTDRGDALISADTEGSTSLLFGPAALREIQAGVANGDWSMPPDAALDPITTDNPIPYWTVAAVGTTVTAAMATAVTAAGQSITFTAAAGAATNDAVTFTRYVPIAGNANRNTAYQGELYAITGTGTVGDRQRVRATLSITSTDKAFAALTVSSSRFDTASNLSNKSLTTGWITPDATAAFLLVTVTVSIPSTAPAAAVTLPICEVRLNRGDSSVAFPNAADPTHSPWIISSTDEAGVDTFTIESDASTATQPSLVLEYDEAGLSSAASLNAENGEISIFGGFGGVVAISGDTVSIDSGSAGGTGTGTLKVSTLAADSTTTSDLVLQTNGGDVYLQDTNVANGTNPRLLFRDKNGTFFAGIKSGAANVVQILNGSSTTDYAQLWAERIYPMNGSTASRYIYDNGNQIALSGSGGLDINGVAYLSGSLFSDAISTTTQTSSAAIWVLSTGTTYSLRRNSSSARYKTNIVDADAAVLEAARRVKPRHYESTIADEAGATRLGFIAEEVEAAGLTHAVGYDEEGRPESLDTTALIAALFVRVNDLEARLAELEAR
jgi:hypothetical protein